MTILYGLREGSAAHVLGVGHGVPLPHHLCNSFILHGADGDDIQLSQIGA